MAERMVALRNMVNSTVSIRKPEYGVKRTWKKRGQTISLPYSVVEEMLWDTGFSNMIKSGILYIDSMKDKIDLGLEDEGAKKPENIIALSLEDMNNYWTTMPLDEFKYRVSNLPRVQVDNLVSYAIEKEVADSAKSMFIKELTGRDIFSAISLRQKERLEDKKAAMNDNGKFN